MTDPGVLQAAWARVVVGTLVASGARRAIVCPGSRSTPFLLALLESAGVERYELVDERVAGFAALGFARVDGIAPLVLCTSGSAVAHLHPAVVEADIAGLPLLVLSADRPLALQDSGANQTIDQSRLFGSHVRAAIDGDPGDLGTEAFAHGRRLAALAWHQAHGDHPGPVQFNLRARKPLEPGGSPSATTAVRELAAVWLGQVPIGFRAVSTPAREGLLALADAIAAAHRPLVVGGPEPFRGSGHKTGTRAFLRAKLAPVAVDPGSLLHGSPDGLQGGGLLLETSLAQQADLVVAVGPPPTSTLFESRLGARTAGRLVVLGGRRRCDPTGTAFLFVDGDIDAILGGVTRLLRGRERQIDPSWAHAWRSADRLARQSLAAEHGSGALSELVATQMLAQVLGPKGLLVVGNSLPIRHAVEAGVGAGLAVATQRGASGIDGLVAGAAASARAWGHPTGLVLGDLSALHDLGGLAAAASLAGPTPLLVMILDNRGGRIFERLPVAQAVEDLEPWVQSAASRDLGAIARAFGLSVAEPTDRRGLGRALRGAKRRPGPTVVVVRVAPGDANERARRVRREIDLLLMP